MALRLVEILAPADYLDAVLGFVRDHAHQGCWSQPLTEKTCLVRVLLTAGEAEAIIDTLEKRFSNVEGFRLLLLPVEASIPRPKESSPPIPGEEGGAAPPKRGFRISREELYEDLKEGAELTPVFAVMVVLSAVVAAVGLTRNNPAIIIGAMVIAPLLAPNMALALATTLGDMSLAGRAVRASLAGIGLAIPFAVGVGALFRIDPAIPEIASRTTVGLGDVALALASGGAGALAVATGVATPLVGVMVAVALLPPLITGGILLGSGHPEPALGAFLLFLVNLVCVNLAGVTTFLLQGIRPKRWYEAKKAGQAVRNAVLLWGGLLAVLVAAVLTARAREEELLVAQKAPLGGGGVVEAEDATADRSKREALFALYEGYRERFPEVPEVSAWEASMGVGRGEAVLVDVREERERAISMIPGAVREEVYRAHPERYADRPVIVYATAGLRSGLAAQAMRARGIEAANLRGGILGWLHAGFEVVDERGRPLRRVHVYGPEWNLAPRRIQGIW